MISGFIRGPGDHPTPIAFSFHDKFKQGPLLSVVSPRPRNFHGILHFYLFIYFMSPSPSPSTSIFNYQ